MFWRMTGLSTISPVETILDKENFTLEMLLDEDEIIQECKGLNARLINFLRERAQVEQLIRYIVEEAPEDADKRRSLKFPFVACEIFTCEVDVILKTVVDDDELMNLLFSFLDSKRPHSMLLTGYFSKVVICLLVRKTVPFMQYVQAHQEIIGQLVDLIGITSIMEVLIRLISADDHMNTNYTETMQWLEDLDVLEMIVDKFSSSDCPEVHANAAETLCTIARCAPPGITAKISSPSFVGKLFRQALEGSRPKSVLVNILYVCISLLDPKRLTFGTYPMFNRQQTNESSVVANPEIVEGMVDSLGDLIKLLDVSTCESVLVTTYGKLQPPLGKHRLKIVEFVSVLLTAGSEAAEKELIHLGAIKLIIDLFFEYPYNNFVHHHVENIIVSCMKSNNAFLNDHVLHDCNLVGKILDTEKNATLETNPNKPTVSVEGRTLPRLGNIGHLTRISNMFVELANNKPEIQAHLQANSEWVDWHANVLQKRNSIENVNQWACGRPTALHDRNRDNDDDDYQDKDYDLAALANNLNQAFQYGIYHSDGIDEDDVSAERDKDVYFDDESAEVVISSLRLGDDNESSIFSNSNWLAFEDNQTETPPVFLASPSPGEGTTETGQGSDDDEDEVMVDQIDDVADTATSSSTVTENIPEMITTGPSESDKSPEWVEWRETIDSGDQSDVKNQAITPVIDHVQSDGANDDNDLMTIVPETSSGSENVKMEVKED